MNPVYLFRRINNRVKRNICQSCWTEPTRRLELDVLLTLPYPLPKRTTGSVVTIVPSLFLVLQDFVDPTNFRASLPSPATQLPDALLIMADFCNAETATKYLRSKSDLGDILSAARKFLTGNTDIFFPSANTFILDLLVDRFNENGAGPFKHWLLSADAWSLATETCLSFNDDHSLKNRLLHRLRLVEVVTTALASSSSALLWANIFAFLDVCCKDLTITIDHSTATLLLAAYAQAVSLVVSDPAQRSRWTSTIISLYQIPHYNTAVVATKKSYTKFILEAVPAIVNYVASTADESATLLRSLLVKEAFNDSTESYLINALLLLVKKASVSLQEMELLFRIIMQNIAASRSKECEELFLVVVASEQYQCLSESLLLILAGTNRRVSNAFLTDIYRQQVAEKDVYTINWSLVSYLVALSPEIGMEHGPSLFGLLSDKSVKLGHQLSVGAAIARSFDRASELPAFFSLVWYPTIMLAPVWRSSEFIETVSQCIVHLSSAQISQLLQQLCEKLNGSDDAAPLVVAILRGLASTLWQTIESCRAAIEKNCDMFAANRNWQILYYILCLYGNVLSLDEHAFDQISDHFQFFVLFRLIEIKGGDDGFTKHYTSFASFLEINPLMIFSVLQRWSLILNKFLHDEILQRIVKVLFETLSVSEVTHFLTRIGGVIFEQSRLMRCILQYASDHLDARPELAHMIAAIPVECFEKRLKSTVLEKLSGIAFSRDEHDLARIAIYHILSMPPFKSDIEVKFENLIRLLETSRTQSCESIRVVERVWKNHLVQCGSDPSKSYVSSGLAYMSRYFEKKHSTKSLDNHLKVLLVMMGGTAPNEDIQRGLDALAAKLSRVILQSVCDSLQSNVNCDFIQSQLQVLIVIMSHNSLPDLIAQTKQCIIEVDRFVLDSSDGKWIAIRKLLFELTVKIAPRDNNDDALYVASLFIALETAYDFTLMPFMLQFVLQLSEDTFMHLCLCAQASINDVNAGNLNVLTHLMILLMHSLKKTCTPRFKIVLFQDFLAFFLGNMNAYSPQVILEISNALRKCLCDQMWLFNQHGIETILVVVDEAARVLSMCSDCASSTNAYVATTQIVAHVLLFHRYKLSLRHHLLLSTHIALLHALAGKLVLSKSVAAAEAYARLLGNLCEPSNQGQEQNSVNTVSGTIKRALRKHLPVLLINYIHTSLKYRFSSVVAEPLNSGMFKVFDVLSHAEFQLVSASLDVPGKTYFNTLYNNYKDHGKWRNS